MEKLAKRLNKKRVLIVNCYFDELRIPVRRKTKFPQSMTPAFLAGVFSSELWDIKLYDEVYSGPLEDEKILAFPDMLILTGLNVAFDRMLHITAYVRTKNPKAVVVAGGPAIRALPTYSKNFFDYCCTGDIEQLHEAIEEAFGKAYISETFLEKGWVIPRFDLAYWMKAIAYVESSRNCYFRCNYCSLTGENVKYQPYEISYLRHQFMALGKQRNLHFLDNNFASFNRRFLLDRFELLRELWTRGYFQRWGAEVTSDFFLIDQNLEFAVNTGCAGLFSGVESFDKQALLNFKKYQNTCLPQEQIIRKCLNYGIPFYYGIVFDLTTRPISELKEELEFIIGNPEITLPSFITLAIPLLGTPFFYECLKQKLFLPNIRLRDLDGTTITLKPLDSLIDAVQFVEKIQTLRGYKSKIIRHMSNFFRIYKNVLRLENIAMVQYSALLLLAPRISTAGSDIGRLFLSCFNKQSRTFVGSTELLDSVYQPEFSIDSRYQHYFEPTMLTDGNGDLCEALHPDLLQN